MRVLASTQPRIQAIQSPFLLLFLLSLHFSFHSSHWHSCKRLPFCPLSASFLWAVITLSLLPLPLILSPQSPLQYPTFSQVQHKSIQLHHFRLNANLSLGNVAHPSCIQLVQTAVDIPVPTMQVHTRSCCSHPYRHFPKAILRLLQMQHHIMPPKK